MARKTTKRKKRVYKPSPNAKKITAFRMPDDLMADLGTVAANMSISRNKLSELILRKGVNEYLGKDTAGPARALEMLTPQEAVDDRQVDMFA